MSQELDIEIRKMRPGDVVKLSRILECADGWKQLMAIIPADEGSGDMLKYSAEQIKIVDCCGKKYGKMCGEILLDEWGTSGRVRPRLSTLVKLLAQAQLFRAADFVATLLNSDLPERPTEGPAAPVEIPDVDDDVFMMKASPQLFPPSAPPLSIQLPSAPPPPPGGGAASPYSLAGSPQDVTPPVRPPRNKSKSPIPIIETPPTGQSLNGRLLDETALVNSVKITSFDEITGNVPEYRYADLERGTQRFNKALCLGGGAFGEVYLCRLDNDVRDDACKMVNGNNETARHVAVKRLFEIAPGGCDPVALLKIEVNHLAAISHPNLLSVLGYSLDGPSPCLLYAYMPNGSLQDRIECKGGAEVLSWKTRLDIAIGSCEGILHLHSSVDPRTKKVLVHRDIKSANILLDQNMIPKVGDFGLIKPGASGQFTKSILTSTCVGTSAYMAPEAFRGDISVKLDVFSFGVVLLELITGLPPYDEERDGRDLASHVEEANSIDELIDPKLSSDSENRTPFELYEISILCLLEKKRRPLMNVVLDKLRSIPQPPE